MTDLDRTFRSLDLLDAPDVLPAIIGKAAGPEPSMPGPSRGSRAAAVLVAIAVFAVAVALGVRVLRSPPADEPTPTVSEQPAPPVDLGLGKGFTSLTAGAEGQGIGRAYGDGLLFEWGGQQGDSTPHRDEGQILDIASDTWTPVAQAPLSPRSDPAVVWTGTEFIVWGGRDGEDWPPSPLADGAAYDPVSDTWRPIAPPPIDPLSPPSAVVWTGSEMLVWGDWFGATDALGAAYDPAADSWRELPTAPVRFNDVSAVWTGSEMVVFGARLGNGNRPQTPATGAAYDPSTDSWRALPDTDLSPNSTEIAWDGERLIAMDYGHESFALVPTEGTWVELGRLPANQCEGGLSTPATVDGAVVVVTCGEVVALEPGADRWRVIKAWNEEGPAFDYGGAIAADGAVLLDGIDDLIAYVPEPSTPERDAWDVASLYGALRAGYPYSPNQLPDGVEEMADGLLAADAEAAYDDDANGLPPLWTYYYGFQVLAIEQIEGDLSAFRVELLLEKDQNVRELLTIGPGTSADGTERPFVILDVDPG